LADDHTVDPSATAALPVESEAETLAESRSDSAAICSADSLLSAILEECHGAMLTAISPIAEELALLREEFAKRLSYDATKEDAFSRLYREMDDSRTEQKLQQFRPIYLDLILLLDRIEQNHANVINGSTVKEDFAALLKSLNDEVLEILFRGEVEPIANLSSKFDPTSQRAVGLEAALEQQEHHDVARVVRRGFKFRNHILRAEEVVVKKFA
jgi:molecular chaperone GrpE (heat shock protein)